MRRARVTPLPFLILLLSLSTPILAVEGDIAPMLGLRFGGTFDVRDAGDETLDAAPSFGVIVDFAVFKRGSLQLLVSHQSSELEAEVDGERVSFDLDIDYVHMGTTYEFGRRSKMRKYVGATLGVTHYDAQDVSQEDSLAFSASFGGGVKWWLRPRLGVRFDGRGYVSFATTDGGAVCADGQCVVQFSGDGWGQIEASAGLLIRFGNTP